MQKYFRTRAKTQKNKYTFFGGSVFGVTDSSTIENFSGRWIISQIVSPEFFSSFFVGKSAQKILQEHPPGKSPAKSSKIVRERERLRGRRREQKRERERERERERQTGKKEK